jgi:hypothetical protein
LTPFEDFMKVESTSRTGVVLLVVAIAFFAIWHERDALFDIARQAAQTDTVLDAKDASGK